MNKLLTIFTPTYNRAYCLGRAYASLCKQTNKNFEWLIVDDGSTDNTQELVEEWKKEKKISIRYYFQKNAGKSIAHNMGVHLADSELFSCLDSDDTLTSNAIEIVESAWRNNQKEVTGFVLMRKFSNNHNLQVTKIPISLKESTLYDAYNFKGLQGDTMLVFRTCIIKQFEFPHFKGEKFVPESYLYDLIDTKGKLLFIDKAVYECEYQTDGYTCNMAKLLKNNPHGYIAYINQRMALLDKTIKWRFLNSARYVSIMLTFDRKNIFNKAVYPFYTFLAFPLGFIVYWNKFRSIK